MSLFHVPALVGWADVNNDTHKMTGQEVFEQFAPPS